MRKSDINHAAQALEFLATWPLRYAVTVALAMVFVASIAAMIPMAGKQAVQQPLLTSSSTTNVVALAQHIADAHLFGQEPGLAFGAGAAAPAPNIKVEGLLYSDDPKEALAILDVNGASGTFKVGDVLADGEKLSAIAPSAVQLTQGMVQRTVEMPNQFGGPGDGIALAGATGLGSDGTPGFASSLTMPTYQPALRTISVPDGADPLEQLRALRQQLITPSPQIAPNPTKHPAKP